MIPLQHIGEVAGLLLAAYLFGCSIGYGAHRLARAWRSTPRPAVEEPAIKPVSAARRLARQAERESDPMPVAPMASVRRPPELPAPRGGLADELRKIKGIGQKTEAALHDLGIYHFDQIAAWSQAHVDWLEGRIAIKGRIRREQWIEQATLLATETPSSKAA